MRKLGEGRIIWEKFSHASLKVDYLNKITISRLVIMEKGKYRLCFRDTIRVGSQLSNSHFKHGSRIYKEGWYLKEE
jgi:hypothetical protein